MMGQLGKPGCIDCVDGICDMNCGAAASPPTLAARPIFVLKEDDPDDDLDWSQLLDDEGILK